VPSGGYWIPNRISHLPVWASHPLTPRLLVALVERALKTLICLEAMQVLDHQLSNGSDSRARRASVKI